VEEVELAEVLDDCLLDRALKAEVELLERLVRREARGLDALAAAGGLPRGGLGRQQRLSEALIRPFFTASSFGQLG
jgi:hypothetical protein